MDKLKDDEIINIAISAYHKSKSYSYDTWVQCKEAVRNSKKLRERLWYLGNK